MADPNLEELENEELERPPFPPFPPMPPVKHHNILLDYYPLGPWFWEHPHCHHFHPQMPPYREFPAPIPPMPPVPPVPPKPHHPLECVPHVEPHFLNKDNFLHEFASEQDKMKAREALGITKFAEGAFPSVRVFGMDNFLFKGFISYKETNPDEPLDMWTKVATIIGSGLLNIAYIYSNGKIIDGSKSLETKVYTNTIHAEEDGKIYIEKDDDHVRVVGSDVYVKDATCFAEGFIQPVFNVGNLKVMIHRPGPFPPYRISTENLALTQLWDGEAGTKAATAIMQKTIEILFNRETGVAVLDILEGNELNTFLDKIFRL